MKTHRLGYEPPKADYVDWLHLPLVDRYPRTACGLAVVGSEEMRAHMNWGPIIATVYPPTCDRCNGRFYIRRAIKIHRPELVALSLDMSPEATKVLADVAEELGLKFAAEALRGEKATPAARASRGGRHIACDPEGRFGVSRLS